VLSASSARRVDEIATVIDALADVWRGSGIGPLEAVDCMRIEWLAWNKSRVRRLYCCGGISPAVPKVLGEASQQPIEAARALPELEAAMTRLVGRISRRQVVPRRAGAQDQSTPFMTSRGSVHGRPRPSGR
jgi:hypothetical protein